MTNNSLAEKIVSFRKSKGFSQEELASTASINLRTLQRIENGQTIPRGYTIRMIADALEISIEDLQDLKKPDKSFLQILNLSALSFWIFPFGNIIVPLTLWLMMKNKAEGVQELGRRILNFQITWSIIILVLFITILLTSIFGRPKLPEFFQLYLLIAIAVLYLFNSVIIGVAAFQIKKGQENVYTMGFRIVG